MRAPRMARHFAVAAGIWLVLGPLSLVGVLSAVTIAGFEVEAGEEEIFVYWETASEIGNLGFYVWRSEDVDTGYAKLPLDAPTEQFIPSEDFGVGAFYEYMDTEVTPGVLYYYKVQDIPANGSPGEMVGPKSAGIDLTPDPTTPPPDTATPTATPTSTATASPEQATPTSSPPPTVQFWAEETSLTAGECTTVQWIANNVQAVFFDGTAATGQGARTYCPCEEQSHTLRVTYQDGRSEDFTLTLAVSGTCNGSSPSSPLATPTPRPTIRTTATPRPSATPQPTAMATEAGRPTVTPGSRRSTVTPTPTPVPTVELPEATKEDTTDDRSVTEIVTDASAIAGPTVTLAATGSGAVVEGLPASRTLPMGLLMGLAAVAGSGLVAVGLWLWRRG